MLKSVQFSDSFLRHEGKVQIVYFSGTGGTAHVVLKFETTFAAKGMEVIKVPLDLQETGYQQVPVVEDSVELLMFIFPVHAFDAPAPVYEWISGIPQGKNLPCAIISVSGGGETGPNKGCRAGCIELLESKGYAPFYERMLVMPSNIFIATNEQLALNLLKILPQKVELSVSEILAGAGRRNKRPLTAGIFSVLSRLEKRKAREFGRDLKAQHYCTGCGWCAIKCPRKNIKIVRGKPAFGGQCVLCLRCIYGCPVKAIYSQHYSPLLVKEGYSLKRIEKRMDEVEVLPLDKIKVGIMFFAVKRYLENINY